jgi:DUF4097 and DUF4098 domain-containing protein YvlB
VEVTAAEGGVTEVEVVALRDDEGTRRAAEETRVDLTERGGRYEVVVESPERSSDWSGVILRRGPKLGVTVRCPSGTDLEVKTASAPIRANGTFGSIETKTASGDITLDDARSLSAASASGDVTVRSVAQGCSVKTASGDARLGTVGGPLTVSLVSGDLELTEARDRVTVSTVSGDQRVGAVSAGPVRLSSVSGDVHVGVRPGLRLYLDVGTVSGSARSDLDPDDAAAGEGEPVELRVRTVSGDARIERAGAPAPTKV